MIVAQRKIITHAELVENFRKRYTFDDLVAVCFRSLSSIQTPTMLIDNPIAINVLVCFVMILLCYNDRATAIRCSRIPEGFGAKRTVSPGNFRLRLSDDSGFYKPGRTYTSK